MKQIYHSAYKKAFSLTLVTLATIAFLALFSTMSSCNIDMNFDEQKRNSPQKEEPINQEEPESKIPSILSFTAEGGDTTITTKWAVSNFTEDYALFLIDGWDTVPLKDDGTEVSVHVEQTQENIEIPFGTREMIFENLTNSEVSNYQKTPIYTYTLILKDKDGNEIEKKYAQATPAPAIFEYNYDEDGNVAHLESACWIFVLRPDYKDHNMAKTYSDTDFMTNTGGFTASIKGSSGIYQLPAIYNNPTTVTKLMKDSGYLESDDFKKKLEKLEEGEEIKWFTMARSSFHLEIVGQVVKTALEKAEFEELTYYECESALSLQKETKAFYDGTKIRTKGYFEKGDGGEALYEISGRAKYTYGSIKTATGQWCNIIPENNKMNLLSLGAGKCFQVTWEKYPEWREYQAAKRKADSKKEKLSSEWDKFRYNSDLARIEEANKILQEYRKSENETITLFIPRGNYRMGGSLGIGIKNYVLKGETVPRHLTPDQLESFEKTFEKGDESGSSSSGGTILYGDNGGSGSLSVWGPSYNVLIEGITWESREIDSKRTYWHSTERDSTGNYARDENGNYLDINYVGRGTSDKSMADEQWFSRQVNISQCQNVTIRDCEFIITNHIRDMAVYPSNMTNPADLYDFGGAFGEYPNAEGTVSNYQANPYVERCDLHTDKQFTTLSFYSGWKNAKVEGCLLYNMSGVFRGASVGFLDFYGEQCENGTVNNCTMYHNCHDEQIGIFTPTKKSACYKDGEYINGVHFTNNRVYAMRDEHVDKIKPRIMVFTIGYDGSPDITNIDINGNYIFAENLPSKLFTFGGFSWDGRRNIVVQNNTIELKNSGGSYMFETRPYAVIKGNTINLDSDSGSIGGTIFDVTASEDDIEPQFINNTVNVKCNYTGHISHNGGAKTNGIINGNTFNFEKNATTGEGNIPGSGMIISPSEVKNNTFNVKGRLANIIISKSPLRRNFVIDGNKLNLYMDDHNEPVGDDGRCFGPTFATWWNAPDTDEYKVTISNNTIKAPNCTMKNKHFIRLYGSKGVEILATQNHLEKLKWLRGVNSDSKIEYVKNYDEKGNLLKKEDWCIFSSIEATPEE